MLNDRRIAALILAVAASQFVPGTRAAAALELGLPADCTLGEAVSFSSSPTSIQGPGPRNLCGTATYDRHSGTDLRVLSMKDVARGVGVLAMADGEVLRLRDGEPDKLALTIEERKAVESQECGNGVIIRHGEDLVSQYCHLKQGSVSVKAGETVRRGQRIGAIGASGLAQFPHVHVTIRKGGLPVEPSTGRAVGGGCKPSAPGEKALFSEETLKRLGRGETELLSSACRAAPWDIRPSRCRACHLRRTPRQPQSSAGRGCRTSDREIGFRWRSRRPTAPGWPAERRNRWTARRRPFLPSRESGRGLSWAPIP